MNLGLDKMFMFLLSLSLASTSSSIGLIEFPVIEADKLHETGLASIGYSGNFEHMIGNLVGMENVGNSVGIV